MKYMALFQTSLPKGYNKNYNTSRIIQGYLSLFPWIIFCNKHSSSMFDREILLSNNMKYINNKEGELDEYVIACNVRQRCITNHAYPIIPAVLVAQMVVVSCNKIFGKNTLNGSSYLRCLALPFFCNRPQFRKWKQQTREIIFLHALYPTTNIGHHG